MKNINKKLIVLSLSILPILALGLIAMPAPVKASFATYTVPEKTNPTPEVDSIAPSSANSGSGARTIRITGGGFVPNSVARINGSNRYTTFIDDSHLLLQATAGDMFRTDGGFYVTVFSPAPQGGYSNSSFFTVNNVPVGSGSVNNTNPDNNNIYDYSANTNPAYNNGYDSTQYQTVPANGPEINSPSNLASNVVYGSNTFLPSGVIQWVLFAIIILLIIILVRKIFGARDNYMETPLKYD